MTLYCINIYREWQSFSKLKTMSYKILSIRIDFDLCFNENGVLILQFPPQQHGRQTGLSNAPSPDHL